MGTRKAGCVFERSRRQQLRMLVLSCSLMACLATSCDSDQVTEAEATVASVAVTPSSATLQVGDSIRLQADVRDNEGNPLPGHTVNWTSDAAGVAAVDQNGLVSAVSPGTASVTATVEGLNASAGITVFSPPPPATVDTLFYDDFETGNLSAWDDRYETQAGNYQVVEDPGLAYDGTRLLRVLYPGVAGGAGALSKFVATGDRYYARIRVRFPPTWQGHTKLMLIRGSPTQWGSFGGAGSCPDGTDFITANAMVTGGGDPGPLRFYTYFVDMAHQPGNPNLCWGNSGLAGADPTPGPTPLATYHDPDHLLSRDQWHTLELEVQLNTVGVNDGWQKLWANGTLIAEWVGMRWRTDDSLVLQAFTLENSRSGTQATQSLYVDDVLVTTARP